MILGLLYHDVTFLNFDETYIWQRELSRCADHWIDMSDIPETNLFCSEEAIPQIIRRLNHPTGHGITWIGSGNYHYVTWLLLQDIQQPFTLVLFDNHTDTHCHDDPPGLLSCGSWVTEAISHHPHLQLVLIIGAHSHPCSIPKGFQNQIVLLPETAHPEQWLSIIPTDHVYISIDKDVLDRQFAITHWDQGNMMLPHLLSSLKSLIQSKNVLGIDICGELPLPSSDVWRQMDAIRRNEKTNLSILNSVLL